jgi:leader peptidase (prepilin peptidase)/N-methyltransferase
MNAPPALIGFAAAAVVGGISGILLKRFVGWILAELDASVAAEEDRPLPVPRPARQLSNWPVVAGCLLAVGLWWWEVTVAGLLSDAPRTAAIPRAAGHLVFFWLLAAAAWVDIRYRVIPDIITTPGVVVGLLGTWLLPTILLPVVILSPRSFAAAEASTDLLAAWGSLQAGGPPVSPLGPVIAVVVFTIWWMVCTAPLFHVDEQPSADGSRWFWAGLREPRTLLLMTGLPLLMLAAWTGGMRFAAVESSLIGLAVSAGLVWLTRAGASLALGREAMGMGDVTLMAMVGAWLGWQPAVLTFFLATFIGLGHGLFQLLRHRENELPYGPSLCLAAVIVTIAWRPIWQLTASFFADPLQLGLVLGLVVFLTAVTLFVWQRLRG